jgi:hypothetical protein
MLSGVDLRVRRMETRASTLATFRESSDCALNTDWPAKVELLMLQADAVAIVTDSVILSLFSLSCVLPLFLSFGSLLRRRQLRSLTLQKQQTATTGKRRLEKGGEQRSATPPNANGQRQPTPTSRLLSRHYYHPIITSPYPFQFTNQ